MNGEKIDWHNHPSSAQALGYTNGNAAAALYSSPAEFEREAWATPHKLVEDILRRLAA